jgi:hypothetical protein
VVLCSTVALMMVAPAMSAASPAAARPASQGVSRPIVAASSAAPTKVAQPLACSDQAELMHC